jgi:hypothetical protein
MASKASSNYTNLHLSALAFHRPSNPSAELCQECQRPRVLPEEVHIRVYHNEPSGYRYNSDCYLIKESRYNTTRGWYSPASDDLVADDARVGSAVVGVGWFQIDASFKPTRTWEVSPAPPFTGAVFRSTIREILTMV